MFLFDIFVTFEMMAMPLVWHNFSPYIILLKLFFRAVNRLKYLIAINRMIVIS